MNDTKESHSICSYVEPRFPSITGYGQRKIYGKTKKVLTFSVEKSCYNNSEIPIIDVCLCLKPQANSVPTNELDTLTILSDRTVTCSSGNTSEDTTQYTFSNVFGPSIDQKELFNTWMYNKVLRFLDGNNELIFAYGTTNAERTYTIHGNLDNPGIIPRTLQLVFNSLENKLMSQCKYKPDTINNTLILNENSIEAEKRFRNNILNHWCDEKIHDGLKSHESQINHLTTNSITKMFDLVKDVENAILNHNNDSYAVWVSYSEIYNESVYDLLTTYSPKQKRTKLKCTLDLDKNVYVRDLSHVFVKSAEEAYKVMLFGKNNLKMSSNKLNRTPSHSHCVFTLRLMRIKNTENDKTPIISSISFCDLAVPKCLEKTSNTGDRLMGSRDISTSLWVLNKCFTVLCNNQMRGENNLVPYRESKLTRVFQTALTGCYRTGISLAVNVDTSPSSYKKTKQVLAMFTIVSSTKSVLNPGFGSAISISNNYKNIVQVESKQSSRTEDEISNEFNNYENKSMYSHEDLKIRLDEEKTKLRQELLPKFHIILNNNKTFHKNQIATLEKNITKMYESKCERIRDYYLEEIREMDENLENFQSSRVSLNNYQSVNNKSKMENYKLKVSQLELKNEELLTERNALKGIQAMRHENLNAKNKQIKNYKILLERASVEYERQEAKLNKINDRYDEIFQAMEEKHLEIERLTGSLEVKDNIIAQIKEQQEELIAEIAELKIMKHMDEHLNRIFDLENNIERLQTENNKYLEANSQISQQYSFLEKKYLTLFEIFDRFNNTNENNLQSPDNAVGISKLQENILQLELKLKEANMASKKLMYKSVSVSTDSYNIDSPLQFKSETEEKENELVQSKTRTVRKFAHCTLDDTMLDEMVHNIPLCTCKRTFCDTKIPFVNRSNK